MSAPTENPNLNPEASRDEAPVEETKRCSHCNRPSSPSSFLKLSSDGEVLKTYKSCSICRANATEFYKKNRERILEKTDLHECECGMMISQTNMSTHKTKSVTHRRFLSLKVGKELTKEECVQLNKEIKNQYRKQKPDPKEKIMCECGSEIIRSSINLHKKTKKHIYYETLKKITEDEVKTEEQKGDEVKTEEPKTEEPDFFYI